MEDANFCRFTVCVDGDEEQHIARSAGLHIFAASNLALESLFRPRHRRWCLCQLVRRLGKKTTPIVATERRTGLWVTIDDGCFCFCGSVSGRLELPLLDAVEGGLIKLRRAAQYLRVGNVSFCVDYETQLDFAFDIFPESFFGKWNGWPLEQLQWCFGLGGGLLRRVFHLCWCCGRKTKCEQQNQDNWAAEFHVRILLSL